MIFEDLPPMEKICQNCNGIGQIPYSYEQSVSLGKKKKTKTITSTKSCDYCNSKGKFLTDFGTALIKLTQDWLINDLRSDIDNITSDLKPYDKQCD